jgi:hypothetical protein
MEIFNIKELFFFLIENTLCLCISKTIRLMLIAAYLIQQFQNFLVGSDGKLPLVKHSKATEMGEKAHIG